MKQNLKIPLSTINNAQCSVHVTVKIQSGGNLFTFYNKSTRQGERYGAVLTQLIDTHGNIEQMEVNKAYMINGDWNVYILSVVKI